MTEFDGTTDRPEHEELQGSTNAPVVDLTTNQHLIWLGQQLNPDEPLYNMIQTFTIEGPIDLDCFQGAFQSLVDASDALRTSIILEDGKPRQRVAESIDAKVDMIDLSSMDNPDEAYGDWLEARKSRALRVGERLFDTALVRTAAERYVWYLCQHHLITDGQSFALTFHYMAERYSLALSGQLAEAPVIPAYFDYVAYEQAFVRSEAHERCREYWKQLVEVPCPAPEFYGRRADSASGRARRLIVDIGREKSASIHRIGESDDFSMLSTNLSLHCIWTTLVLTTLHRVTGETDLRLGTPFEARSTEEFKHTIGLFMEIGALNARIDRQATFRTLNETVMNQVFDGLKHARPGISSAEMNNAYSVLINYVTARMDDFAEMPVRTDWVHSGFSDSAHALRVQVCDFDRTDKFVLHLDVNEDIFGEQQQAWLIEQFSAVIDAFIEDPYRPIGSFDLLTDAQRQLLIHDFNATACVLTEAGSVVELFEAQVERTPDATAVIDQGISTSYAELSARASQLANLLFSRGIGTGDRVAICLGRSAEFLVAVLGTLKAGASFTPIDTFNPPKRKKALLDDLEPAILLADEESVRGLSEDSLPIEIVDPGSTDLDACAVDNRTVSRSGDDIAYFIYTSGSTGTPKAAMLSHAGLLNYVTWAASAYTPDGPLDFPLYSSIAFDLTLTSIFVPLIAGGTIRVYPEDPEAPGLEILEVFADDAVDIVKLTPAHLDLLRDHGASCQRIGKLILGGEDLKTQTVHSFLDAVNPDIEVYNEYGPTEATVGCMIHRFDAESDNRSSVPIGVPAANVRIHIWDAYDQPVPFGVTGEMVIDGPGVALGYWKRDELTEQRFARSADTGERIYRTGDLARWGEHGLQFLGRADEQVKVRGARIELGEIENTLLEYPGISSAAAVVHRPTAASFSNLRHCASCGLPSNYPNSDIDEDGICADCRDYARLKDDVDRYFGQPDQLRSLIGSVRAGGKPNGYDCIVLVSGGKDSTYMLYQLVREFGVRPLAFTLDNGYLSDRAITNVREACDDLGIDLEVASTPHMDEIFADSLRRHCNVCNGCFKTIYTLSMSLARRLGISTIITGLSRGQMFETRLADTFRARQFDPDTIDRLIVDARKFYHRTSDAVYELLDHDLFSDERIFDEIKFIDFYRYVDVGLDELYGYLEENTVWKRPKDTGRSTNCRINDVGIYVHKKMRGYHNYALPYSWDVRLGHKKRSAAMEELDDSIDEVNVLQMLEDIGCDDMPGEEAAASGKLAAYFVSEEDVDPKVMREFLLERLPAFMVPGSLAQLDSLPLTQNGKIDRRKLPDIEQHRPQLESDYVAPSTPLQTQLHAIWSDVIGLSRIGINDDFFELGGDSVMSIRIAAQAQALGLRMNPRQLFLTPTIAGLADVLMTDAANRQPAEAEDRESDDESFASDVARVRDQVGEQKFAEFEDIYPLTPLQQGILFHATASPESGIYLGHVTCPLVGRIELDKLQQAWRRTVARHPVLRTSFFWEQLDRPMQAVARNVEPVWRSIDLRNRPVSDVDLYIQKLQAELTVEGFDLRKGTPMRICFVRVSDDTGYLLWQVHHILLDGWSAYPVLAEWLMHYEAILAGIESNLPLPRPFGEYVRWQAAQNRATSFQFWHDYLSGFADATPLCPPSPRPGERGCTRRIDLNFSSEQNSALRALAKSHRVTLNTVFQAAWAVLVSRYTGNDDVVFGATVSGRNVELAGVESIVGLLLNSLPIRLQIQNHVKVSEWLPSVQDTLSHLSQHEATPLSDIRRASNLPGDQELFDNILVFENYPSHLSEEEASVTAGTLEFNAPSHYPLAVLVYPERTLSCSYIFNSKYFSEDAIRRMSEHFSSLLDAMAAEPDAMLGDLRMLRRDEYDELITNQHPVDNIDPPELLERRIAGQCNITPDTTAITCGDTRVSYSDLESRARNLCRHLTEVGINRNDIVAIEAVRSPDFIVAMLGVWKAGAAFVPIDPEYPTSRIRAIITDARIKAIVTARPTAIDIPGGIAQIDMQCSGTTRDLPGDPIPSLDDLAYVLYTSGSTGRPKGVMVSHRSISLSTKARPSYYPGRIKRFLLLPSFAFDSSLAGLLWTLLDGGEVVLPDLGKHDNLIHLSSLITQRKVSHILTLPSFYELLLEAAGKDGYPSLEIGIVAGETCPPRIHARHLQVCRQAGLYNEYGPTEGTVWSHVYHFTRDFDQSVVPIGKPVGHVYHRVLDRHLHPVPAGVPGELCLGGPGIASGYINDEQRTTERFVDLPGESKDAAAERFYRTGDLVRLLDSGDLEFLGRIDEQIKIRGFRVEPAEIEAALSSLPAVTGVVVAKTATPPERLAAWYTAKSPVDPEALRQSVLDSLPAFMLPDVFLPCDEFPRLSNGKIDRKALQATGLGSTIGDVSYSQPENQTQEKLVAIWAEGLDVDRVGIDDNFFDLGGDSLTAMRMAARAHRQGFIVAPADMMRYPTIRELSKYVRMSTAIPGTAESPPPKKFELSGLDEDEIADLLDELEP